MSAPAITGKPFQAGQYSVAVQSPVPASQTSLGRLAATLGQINPAIKAYGQAQQAETDLQKTTIGLHYSAMEEQEKKAYAAQLATKEKINSRFRGEDYETNPVATLYAKELIGSDLVDDFQRLVELKKEEFIQARVRDMGDKPSPVEINQFTGGLLEEFKALPENEGIFKDSLILDGFMRASASVRNKLNVELPTQAAGIHKAEVVIPKAANLLVRAVNIDSDEIEDPAVLAARIKDAWAATGALNSPEQRAVIAMALNSFPPTLDGIAEAEEFVGAISSAGISIGTQPLDAEDEEGFVYNELLEELSDKKIKIEERLERQYKRLTTKTLRETKDEANQMMANPSTTRDDVNEWVDTLVEGLEEIKDPQERDAKRKSYEILEAYLGTKQDEDVRELFRGVVPEIISTPMYASDLEGKFQTLLNEEIRTSFGDDPAEGPYANVLKQYGELMQRSSDLTGGDGIRDLSSKGMQLLVNPKIKFNREVRDLSEKLANTLPGQPFDYKDFATVTIPEVGYDKFKQELFTKMFSQRREELIEESMENIKAMLAKDKERIDKIQIEETQQVEEVQKLDKAKAHLAVLDVKEGPRFWRSPVSGKEFKVDQTIELQGLAAPKQVTGEYAVGVEDIKGDLTNLFRSETRTAAQVDTFYKAVEDGFDLGAYDGKKSGIILEQFKNHFNSPFVKNRLQEELKFFKERAGSGYLGGQKNRDAFKLVEKTMRNGRRITGFSPEEATQALSTGYLSEGASLGADKFAYFNGLLGEDTGGRATIKLNYTVEDGDLSALKPLADQLGVTPAALHASQQKLENRHKVIKVVEPKKIVGKTPQPAQLEPDETIFEPVKKIEPMGPPRPKGAPLPPNVKGITEEDPQLKLNLETTSKEIVKDPELMFVQGAEGFTPVAKWDNTNYRNGYGTNAKFKGETIDKKEAKKRLVAELTSHAETVDSYNDVYNWTPNERAALVSFTFNAGPGNLKSLTANKTRTKAEIAKKLLEYGNERLKPGAKLTPNKGLQNRRRSEQTLFLKQ